MRAEPPGASPPAAADGYLAEVAELLWPASTLTATRAARGYVVIPSLRRPTLVVPHRPWRVTSAAVRHYNTASAPKSRLKALALAAGLRVGLGELLPARVGVDGRPDIRTELSRVLGRPVDVALYIGPARAVRKPVVQVLDAHGTTLAFAKLGVDEFTRTLVRAEARAVTDLARAPLAALAVPRVLHHGQWGAHELLVQRAVTRGSAAAPGDARLGRAMDELARVGAVSTAPLTEGGYWRRLTGRLVALPAGPLAAELRRSVTELAERRGDRALETGSWHGDWTPWNMTVSGGQVCVWDWERFEADVPIGFDAVHYAVQATVASTGVPPQQAFNTTLGRVPELVAAHGVDARDAVTVFWLYALELAVRYLEDGEPDAGSTAMSRLSEWLSPVLAAAERAA